MIPCLNPNAVAMVRSMIGDCGMDYIQYRACSVVRSGSSLSSPGGSYRRPGQCCVDAVPHVYGKACLGRIVVGRGMPKSRYLIKTLMCSSPGDLDSTTYLLLLINQLLRVEHRKVWSFLGPCVLLNAQPLKETNKDWW